VKAIRRLLAATLAATILLLVFASAFYVWHFDPFVLWAPPDRKLLTVFYNQRATFNRLRDMAHEDRELIQDINEQSVAHSRLSAERREEYLRLISSVNRKLSIESAPNQVTFVFADGNVGLSLWCEWFKGIAYLSNGYENQGRVVNSLDALPKSVDYGVYLVPVEPNWYLIFSKMD